MSWRLSVRNSATLQFMCLLGYSIVKELVQTFLSCRQLLPVLLLYHRFIRKNPELRKMLFLISGISQYLSSWTVGAICNIMVVCLSQIISICER